MSATTLRQWQMLQAIPRYPQKIDTVSLQTKLQESGYDINLRTIQRDLNNLSGVLPIIADNAKPQGWSWIKDAPILSIPALNPQTALTFNLLENYMRQLLPTNTLDYLQPWFKHAQGVLDEQKSELARWPDNI